MAKTTAYKRDEEEYQLSVQIGDILMCTVPPFPRRLTDDEARRGGGFF